MRSACAAGRGADVRKPCINGILRAAEGGVGLCDDAARVEWWRVPSTVSAAGSPAAAFRACRFLVPAAAVVAEAAGLFLLLFRTWLGREMEAVELIDRVSFETGVVSRDDMAVWFGVTSFERVRTVDR